MNSTRLAATAIAVLLLSPAMAWAGCKNPEGNEGGQFFSKTYKTMQYCNGDAWVPMGAPAQDQQALRERVQDLTKTNAKLERRVGAIENQLDKLGIGIVKEEEGDN